MKSYFKNSFLFVLPLILLIVAGGWIILNRFAHKMDPYYLKITILHQEGLVIGTSRAAQAIEPSLFGNMYNFAFTQSFSPFDSSYFDLIKRFHPIDDSKKDRIVLNSNGKLHLICVDPWALCSFPGDQFESSNSSFVGKVSPPIFKNIAFSYLLKFKPTTWKDIYSNCRSAHYVNDGGRFVVDMDSLEMEQHFKLNFQNKLIYNKKKEVYLHGSVSSKRMNYFYQIVKYLQQDGKVVLVQLPVHKELAKLEDKFAPNFDALINQFASKNQVQFINLRTYHDSVKYTDGGHIWNGDALKVSRWIRSRISQNVN